MSNSSILVVFADIGARALLLMYIWLASAITAAELSRSKGYGEKPGLGTGLLLSALGPIIWLVVPPKDELAEWHTRKPWQRRRKPTEADFARAAAEHRAHEHVLPAELGGAGAIAVSAGVAETDPEQEKSQKAAEPDADSSAGSRPGEPDAGTSSGQLDT